MLALLRSLFKQEKDNKKQFFLFPIADRAMLFIALKQILLHSAHRTTPDQCASVGSHYVHAIM